MRRALALAAIAASLVCGMPLEPNAREGRLDAPLKLDGAQCQEKGRIGDFNRAKRECDEAHEAHEEAHDDEEAKDEIDHKCSAFEDIMHEYGESEHILQKSPAEQIEGYLTRVTATICCDANEPAPCTDKGILIAFREAKHVCDDAVDEEHAAEEDRRLKCAKMQEVDEHAQHLDEHMNHIAQKAGHEDTEAYLTRMSDTINGMLSEFREAKRACHDAVVEKHAAVKDRRLKCTKMNDIGDHAQHMRHMAQKAGHEDTEAYLTRMSEMICCG